MNPAIDRRPPIEHHTQITKTGLYDAIDLDIDYLEHPHALNRYRVIAFELDWIKDGFIDAVVLDDGRMFMLEEHWAYYNEHIGKRLEKPERFYMLGEEIK